MKYFIGILFAFASLSVSASTLAADPVIQKIEKKTNMHHVLSRSVKKQIVSVNSSITEDDSDEFDDVDFHIAYRRPCLVDNSLLKHDEYISLRLANSRRLALETHEKTWGSRKI